MLAGYTITRFNIQVKRLTGGLVGPQTLHLYLHTSVDQDMVVDVTRTLGPVDVSIEIGDELWIPLPLAWANEIITNGGGISISGAPQIALEGLDINPDSGLLQIEWSR